MPPLRTYKVKFKKGSGFKLVVAFIQAYSLDAAKRAASKCFKNNMVIIVKEIGDDTHI